MIRHESFQFQQEKKVYGMGIAEHSEPLFPHLITKKWNPEIYGSKTSWKIFITMI